MKEEDRGLVVCFSALGLSVCTGHGAPGGQEVHTSSPQVSYK